MRKINSSFIRRCRQNITHRPDILVEGKNLCHGVISSTTRRTLLVFLPPFTGFCIHSEGPSRILMLTNSSRIIFPLWSHLRLDLKNTLGDWSHFLSTNEALLVRERKWERENMNYRAICPRCGNVRPVYVGEKLGKCECTADEISVKFHLSRSGWRQKRSYGPRSTFTEGCGRTNVLIMSRWISQRNLIIKPDRGTAAIVSIKMSEGIAVRFVYLLIIIPLLISCPLNR